MGGVSGQPDFEKQPEQEVEVVVCVGDSWDHDVMRWAWASWAFRGAAAIGACALFAAQVPRHAAQANVASWLSPLQTYLAAAILRPGLELALTILGAAIGLIGLLGLIALGLLRNPRRPELNDDELIGLPEAARWIYSNACVTTREAMRQNLYEGVEHAGCLFVLEAAKDGVCQLYGRWGEGLPLEEVSAEEAVLNPLESALGSDRSTPADLRVKRRDLPRILALYEL